MSIYNAILLIIVVAVVAFSLAYFGSRKSKDYDRLTMHHTATSLVVASIIASTVSFASVYLALSGKIDTSHQEIFIDILSILVTVLMGWNIISVVDFKNQEEKMSKKVEKIDQLSKDFNHVINGIINLNMYSFPLRGNKPVLINSCFKLLKEIVKCEDRKLNEAAISQNMMLLHTIFESYEKDEIVRVFKGMRNNYLFILEQINYNEYKKEITDIITRAKELPYKEDGIRIEYELMPSEVEAMSQSDSEMGTFNTSDEDTTTEVETEEK